MSNNPKDTKVSPVEILEAIRRNNPSILKDAKVPTSCELPDSDAKTGSKLGITATFDEMPELVGKK
ncbi:MAG: hypothetical protein LBV04_04945 [Deferribacteraceae bacterium]|jgi:hypothetical protein|nr:hypothetical protein [Deferribacteraceae bacterium]